jgi:hypothetical protein
VEKVTLDNPPKAVYKLGNLVAVQYETHRNLKKELYQHRFKSSARPILASSTDGDSLHILGGGFAVTDKGIEG